MVLKVCCARVAQWWSIALPRRGSRVRIPSRALKDTKKEISVGYLLFCMFEPCRVRTVRMSPRCDVSCSQRDRKRVIRWMALFCMFKPCRVRTVRMSTLRSGRRRRTSPGCSATPRALFYKDIQCGCPFFVKKSFTSGVYYKKLLEKVCTLSKKSLEKVYILSKSRLKKFVISYITPLKK